MAQPKYMLIYRGPFANADHPPSPEEMQQTMVRWDAWKQKFKGQIVDLGDGLRPSGKRLSGGVVTDGPYVESKDIIGGYSIVTAETYEQAVVVARECPITALPGATIEIRELIGYA